MTHFFDNGNLFEIIWKWKKHLIIVAILAVVASAFFSSSIFIKPKYKSTARIYPSNNIYTFSDESESEQLLEIISALDIKLRVIDAFNLSEVYKISKQEPQYMTYMLAEFNDNVKFKKTEYETIEIQVLDTDPVRACNMCDSIIHFLDEKIGTLHRIKHEEVITIAKNDYAIINQQIDSVESRLKYLRTNYHIFDYRVQAEEITKGMVNALSLNKNTPGGKEIQKWINDLSEKGGEFEILDKQKIKLVSQKDSILKIYNQAVSSAHRKIVFGQRVQNPVVADKKSYPVRSVIVMISTISALFVSLLVILLIENKNNS
jgi:capsular polysaccharide biosynthesis protein